MRCAAHIVNLVIRDAFREVEFIKGVLEVLREFISKNIVKRYVETRWNSIYNRLKDLSVHLNASASDDNHRVRPRVDAAITALEPFIRVLNIAQTDGTTWPQVYDAFCAATTEVHDKGLEWLAEEAELYCCQRSSSREMLQPSQDGTFDIPRNVGR